MKDNIDKSLVSEHIGESVIVAGVKFDIVEFDGVKDKMIMIKSEQTKNYCIPSPEDTLYDVCNKLWDIMKRNCEIHDNAPLDTSFIEIPSCFMTALRYIMENYNHYTNRFPFEVEELYNLLNEFALEHDDKTLSKIINSYSKGLIYNFITGELTEFQEGKKWFLQKEECNADIRKGRI